MWNIYFILETVLKDLSLPSQNDDFSHWQARVRKRLLSQGIQQALNTGVAKVKGIQCKDRFKTPCLVTLSL